MSGHAKSRQKHSVVALSGGVGGAKLAIGLASMLPSEELMIVANTGDDFEFLGLYISPDIDTLLYTLAGINAQRRGWGRRDESWRFMQAVCELGGEDWFLLGDKDLAMHVMRTAALRDGMSLGEFTKRIAKALGIESRITPATDDPVRTVMESAIGTLSFQHYFVLHRCEPHVKSIRYEGCDDARLADEVLRALRDRQLSAVILCPSNPHLSIGPMLSIPGMRRALVNCSAPVVAVSPIIGRRAVKGPTAKIMADLGLSVSVTAVAQLYEDFLDGILIDTRDRSLATSIDSLGISVEIADIVMRTDADKREVARRSLAFAQALKRRTSTAG